MYLYEPKGGNFWDIGTLTDNQGLENNSKSSVQNKLLLDLVVPHFQGIEKIIRVACNNSTGTGRMTGTNYILKTYDFLLLYFLSKTEEAQLVEVWTFNIRHHFSDLYAREKIKIKNQSDES